MKKSKLSKIYFEPRLEIRPDKAVIETFQDGSQLIRKCGHMIIVEAAFFFISNYQLRANLGLFGKN